jgi:hypothetical protein
MLNCKARWYSTPGAAATPPAGWAPCAQKMSCVDLDLLTPLCPHLLQGWFRVLQEYTVCNRVRAHADEARGIRPCSRTKDELERV